MSWDGVLEPPHAEPSGTRVPRSDTFERARAYVAKMPPAISGQGGHGATWAVARKCAADFGLSESDTLELLREYNQRCEPAWSDRELSHKAHDAVEKARIANPVSDRHWEVPREHYEPKRTNGAHAVPPADDYEHTDDDAPDAEPSGDNLTTRAGEQPKREPRRAISIADVLDQWRADGPLIHEPTGIATLDELTGGGPVYGTRWTFTGAPDAGKTALLVQIAHVYALRGIAVGLVAADEDAGDLVTRLAQRSGWSRHHCETRDPRVLDEIADALRDLPIRYYTERWTLESAAADLVAFARAHTGGRAMLGVDSLQTVRCDAELAAERELSERAAVTARTHAIRDLATRHRLIALSTSEMNRGGYRSADAAERTNDLASGAESRAIEYSARVMLALRSVQGETDLVELHVAKNKHGAGGDRMYFRLDRRCQTLTLADYTPAPADSGEDRDTLAMERVVTDAVAVALLVRARPGTGARALRAAMRAETGMGVERLEAAVSLLGDALVRGVGPRGAVPLTLDLDRVPERVRHAMEPSHE